MDLFFSGALKHKRGKGTDKQALVAVEHQGAVRSDLVASDMSILVLPQDGTRMLKIDDKEFFLRACHF